MVSVSFITPAHNEEANLEEAVRLLERKLRESGIDDYEVLLYDDASNDETPAIARRLAQDNARIRIFTSPVRQGLGRILMRGFAAASKEYVGMHPAHNQHAAETFDSLLPALGSDDVVVAYIANPKVRPLSRRLASRTYVSLVNTLYGLDLPYYNFAFFRTARVRPLAISTQSHFAMAEILIRLFREGATHQVVPFYLHTAKRRRSLALRPANVARVLLSMGKLFVEQRRGR